MVAYSLERLNVLVVEDNPFVGSLICDVLGALGFGRTLAASDGADARDRLVRTKTAPHEVGASHIDLVISDIVMPGMDGIDLVRWIRNDAASPQRFMPVIMLSAAADRVNVQRARDVGANEFVVKPFTADKIASRLLAVIDQPREFIYCKQYFGPDRRRIDVGPPEGERRLTSEQEVRLVYSELPPEALSLQGMAAVRYVLPNALRDRVGGTPGRRGSLQPHHIIDAEAVVSERAGDHVAVLQDFIKQLTAALAACSQPAADDADPDVAARASKGGFAALNRIAMELRGLAEMFGYPLITTAARSLYQFTVAQTYIDEDHLELVKAHVDFLSAVVREGITGDGGELGRDLLASLNVARQRYRQRNAA